MGNNIRPEQISIFDFNQNRSTTKRIRFNHRYNDIVSFENLLTSWQEFLRGKKNRKDVATFTLHFSDNLVTLHQDLITKQYRHGGYFAFKISDPKPRDIHKASLRDRIVHHALYRSLYPYFDRQFIFDSYSCRLGKGTYKAMDRARSFGLKVSQNNTKTAWVLKGDIRKFFASIDHTVLKKILRDSIEDPDTMWLLEQVIDSFSTDGKPNVGLPLGNLTSQLLVNIYMNQFDQFVKRSLKEKYYIRYADDFLIFSQSKVYLEELIPKLSQYLETNLKLSLNSKKVFIKTLASGVDFLGWIHFSHHRILRTATKHHMLKRLQGNNSLETLNSYLGMLGHGNTFKLSQKIMTESLRDKEIKESKNQNSKASNLGTK